MYRCCKIFHRDPSFSFQYKMEKLLQNQLMNAAVQLENQLDSEIARIDNLDSDDIEAIRMQRLKDLKKQSELRQEWKAKVKFH